jgi:hypothetical protein
MEQRADPQQKEGELSGEASASAQQAARDMEPQRVQSDVGTRDQQQEYQEDDKEASRDAEDTNQKREQAAAAALAAARAEATTKQAAAIEAVSVALNAMSLRQGSVPPEEEEEERRRAPSDAHSEGWDQAIDAGPSDSNVGNDQPILRSATDSVLDYADAETTRIATWRRITEPEPVASTSSGSERASALRPLKQVHTPIH